MRVTKRRAGRDAPPDPAVNREAGFAAVRASELYGPLLRLVRPVDIDVMGVRASALKRGGLLAIDAQGGLVYNGRARAEVATWTWSLSHVLTHLGLGHANPAHRDGRGSYAPEWRAACCLAVDRFLGVLRLPGLPAVPNGFEGGEEQLALRLAAAGVPDVLAGAGPAAGGPDLWEDLFDGRRSRMQSRPSALGRTFAAGLATLEEGIRAVEHPGQAWDAQLASWFGDRFPREAPVLALPPASQAVAQAVDRPRRHPEVLRPGRDLGMVLDAPASADVRLLGRAVQAIASSATASHVHRVRLVVCGATAHDAGWLAPDRLASQVRAGGRGGTVLQHGVDLLRHDAGFPTEAPVLLVTDGRCERVRVHRDHAWVTTGQLPFATSGPVFRLN